HGAAPRPRQRIRIREGVGGETRDIAVALRCACFCVVAVPRLPELKKSIASWYGLEPDVSLDKALCKCVVWHLVAWQPPRVISAVEERIVEAAVHGNPDRVDP